MSKNKNLIKIKKPKNINTIFGLPAKTYTDHEFWKKECNTALANGWLFVGFVHELLKAGDIIPIFIAHKPYLLVKNNNNEIKEIPISDTPFKISPLNVSYNENTDLLYVVNSSLITVIDGSTNNVLETIPVGVNLIGLSINPNTNLIYA